MGLFVVECMVHRINEQMVILSQNQFILYRLARIMST
jgi:hypothetical protein